MSNSTDYLIPHSHSVKPDYLTSLRSLFYLLTPKESSFKDVTEVPNYTDNALAAFISLVLIELAISTYKGKKVYNVNHTLTSMGAGLCSRLISLISTRSIGISMYFYVYENWRLCDLPWDSTLTWIVGFIGMDFLYYWFHRAAHEINFLWAAHQTHHSSEDYNLSTALRQSAFQWMGSMFFYLPNALLVPPSVHLVHLEINILFQFWIHTRMIDTIGPLEYILNTASHHRVHHGRNPYCIDKNYAGTLIIWDRMFGTFAAERKDEEIAYGLVHNLDTFDPLYVQLCSYQYIWNRFWSIEGIGNKLSVILKGPGWEPGKPRLGFNSDIPEIQGPIVVYSKPTHKLLSVYAIAQHFAFTPIYDQLIKLRWGMMGGVVIFDIVFILFTLTCLGMLFDAKKNAYQIEMMRCLSMAVILAVSNGFLSDEHKLPKTVETFLLAFYSLSAVMWTLLLMNGSSKKKEKSS